MSLICLSLLGAPALEEKLLDQLLQSTHDLTFTSQNCASHGGHGDDIHSHGGHIHGGHIHGGLDASEQVLGRARAVLVQVLVPESIARQLIADLGVLFRGSGLRYWLTPVLEEGQFQ